MRFRPLAWKREKARAFDRSFGVDGPCQESQLRAGVLACPRPG
jgi:hypothetical protein